MVLQPGRVSARPAWGKEESVQVILASTALVEEHPWVKRGWSQSLCGGSTRRP